MTDAEIQSKLAECQDMIRLLTAKLTEVAAERDRLRAEKSDALSVCQEMYNNPDVPPALRLKAAGLALPHETPRLDSGCRAAANSVGRTGHHTAGAG